MRARSLNIFLNIFLCLCAVLGGCTPLEPEASLYHQAGNDPRYTIYNVPTPYLTTKEQNIRSRKQGESIRAGHIKIGITGAELVEIWGRPNDIKRSQYATGKVETFIYESTRQSFYYFVFVNSRLSSWHKG